MKKKQKRSINLIRSQIWMDDDITDIQEVLDNAIEDFVDDERIINIEMKEKGGLKRFWIYVEELNSTKQNEE